MTETATESITLIRSTHPHAYRSGKWARLVGTMDDPETGRRCYSVMFPDGAADWWPVDDKAHGYEIASPAQLYGRMAEVLRPGFEEFARVVCEAWRSLKPLLAVLAEAEQRHRAEMSAVHREYARRQRARRRRR
jgi:hypothetical protein